MNWVFILWWEHFVFGLKYPSLDFEQLQRTYALSEQIYFFTIVLNRNKDSVHLVPLLYIYLNSTLHIHI